MIPLGVDERLRAHVASVLATAHVPRAERDDLGEELYGHLVEHWQALVDEGLDPMEAADRAVRRFGTAHRIGGELTRTYRGRVWASTIGALLPDEASPGRPMAVTLMVVLAMSMSAIHVLLAIEGLLNHPPVEALVWATSSAIAAAAILVLGIGLLRAQRWAVWISLGFCILLTFAGVMDATRGTLSLSGALAFLAFITWALDRSAIDDWQGESPRPRSMLLGGLALAIGAGWAGQSLAATLPDPTQASPQDLSFTARIRCAVPLTFEVEELDGTIHDVVQPGLVVEIDASWERQSILPSGISNRFPVDNITVEGAPDEWTWIEFALLDPASGAEIQGAGGLGPGGPLDTTDVRWSASISREELLAT